jgi:hypothetical protein
LNGFELVECGFAMAQLATALAFKRFAAAIAGQGVDLSGATLHGLRGVVRNGFGAAQSGYGVLFCQFVGKGFDFSGAENPLLGGGIARRKGGP